MKMAMRTAAAAALATAALNILPSGASAEVSWFLVNPESISLHDEGSPVDNVIVFYARLYSWFGGRGQVDVTHAAGPYERGLILYCANGARTNYAGGAQGTYVTGAAAGDVDIGCYAGAAASTGYVWVDSMF
jgi:hypothetical protein